MTYFGSVGVPVMRLRELGESYEAASHGFSYRFLTEPNQIVDNHTVFDQTRNEKNFPAVSVLWTFRIWTNKRLRAF